jgi:hypothetical protein
MIYKRLVWDSTLPNAHDYKCRLCPEYNILLASDKLTVESEGIRVKNHKLVFYPNKKLASVWRDDDANSFIKVSSFSLNELTHELAVQWVNKLKTYVIFQ